MRSRANYNLEVLVFRERGKPEYSEENLSEQTQPTYGADARIRALGTIVLGNAISSLTIVV